MYKINVYKLWWADNDRDLYVGSTKRKLCVRMASHRSLCRSGRQYKLYNAIRTNGYDFNYVLIESYEVSCRDEQVKWEQRHIDLLKPNLNDRRAYNSPEYTKQYDIQYATKYNKIHKEKIKVYRKQYEETHKDKIQAEAKEYNRQYRKKNKDKIKSHKGTNIECICGATYTRTHKLRHTRTQKHKKNLQRVNLYYLGLLPFQ